jgi:non-specific serine/threonine protein kinase/serine/threonine-protein kinase
MAQRLALFMRVCEGVQHAHQKAVIHRDLKPSNVLVTVTDGEATPKIIDFGVAKATAHRLTEKTVYTELGVLIGTPAYMSPEQADLTGQNIDTRTDVYSLGVLLYELLTGALPFDPQELRAAGFDEIRRRIREIDPPRPSTRLENLPGDTSTVSARNRDTLPATLVRQLRRELDWITMRALEKDRTRRYATPSELATDIGRFLRDEPVLAGPPSGLYRAKKYVKRHAWGVTAAIVAVAGLAAFAVLMAIQSARIADERDAARQAEAELQDVAAFQAGMINGIDPKAAGRRVTANLAGRIADAHRERGASEEQVAAALAAHEALLDGVNMTDVALDLLDENILARAVQTLEDRFADQPLVDARLRKVIGDTYRTLGRLEPAETQLRRSLETRKRLLGDDHPYTLASTQNLAKLYKDQRRFDEAEELFLQALRGRERTLGPDDPSVLSSRGNLAVTYLAQGRHEEAERLMLEQLAAWRRVAGDDDRRTIISMNNIGVLYLKQGRFDEAEPLFVESLDARRRLFGDDDRDTLVSMHNLALVYRNQERYEEAEALLVEVLEKRRRLLGDVHPETIRCMHNLALVYRNLGRAEEAAEFEAFVERARRQD